MIPETCEHEYKLCYSTFGSDQGAMCTKCWKIAPPEIEKKLRNEEENKHGPEMKKLLDRLYGDPRKKTLNFSVFPGPKWDEYSLEEKAAIINRALDDENAQIRDNIDD